MNAKPWIADKRALDVSMPAGTSWHATAPVGGLMITEAMCEVVRLGMEATRAVRTSAVETLLWVLVRRRRAPSVISK